VSDAKHRSVLVTGASSGIGAAAAAQLAASGWRVFGTSRHQRENDPAAPIHWVRMDVCDDASVKDGVAEVLAEVGELDALVCNAGFGIFGSVEDVALDDARAQLETNFFGVLRVLRAVLPGMREARAGRVLLVGSLAGRTPIPFQAHYSASKAAVDALALALHNEMHPFGVHVGLIEPGDIATPFNDAMDWSTSPDGSAYAEALGRSEQTIRELLPKAPPPESVARCIVRALEARRPRVRQAVGAESWIAPIGKRLLPDGWLLKTIRSHFRL
jgi:NAD(P)-dependent dehydrogenase (short-subunit alcohol dehydrogenase family)